MKQEDEAPHAPMMGGFDERSSVSSMQDGRDKSQRNRRLLILAACALLFIAMAIVAIVLIVRAASGGGGGVQAQRQKWIPLRVLGVRGFDLMVNKSAVERWHAVLPHVDVVQFYMPTIGNVTIPQLRESLPPMKHDHLVFSAVFPFNLPGAQCNFTRLAIWNFRASMKFYHAGGRLGLWVLDNPFMHILSTGLPHNCKCNPEQAVHTIAGYARKVEQLLRQHTLPPVTFCIKEPVAWYEVGSWPADPYMGNPPVARKGITKTVGDLGLLLPRLQQEFNKSKTPLGSFYAEHPVEQSVHLGGHGYPKLRFLQNVVRHHKMRFGKKFMSPWGAHKSPEAYYERAMQDHEAFVEAAGEPNDIILEVGFPYPDPNGSITEPYTFEWDADHFFPPRERRCPYGVFLNRRILNFMKQHHPHGHKTHNLPHPNVTTSTAAPQSDVPHQI